MTDENLQPLERIPRHEVYSVPWFAFDDNATTGSGSSETMDL